MMKKLIDFIASFDLFIKIMVSIGFILLLIAIYYLLREGISWENSRGAILACVWAVMNMIVFIETGRKFSPGQLIFSHFILHFNDSEYLPRKS